MDTDEERIALFLDYENLAIGARDNLGGTTFDLRPIADALAERGRVVVRRAYADWSYFDEDRRMLTRSQVELIEIPQRMGASRKNAADIKMAVDAIEMAFERDYITTFVICTGDSDFTPLVHKLRELNKRVIGVGVKDSTSALLPPACDEFLFYDRSKGSSVPAGAGAGAAVGSAAGAEPAEAETPVGRARARGRRGSRRRERAARRRRSPCWSPRPSPGSSARRAAPVLASSLKRALLRKDPTFSESDYGFRAFGELAAPPRRAQRRRAERGLGQGRPRGVAPRRTATRSRGLRAAPLRGGRPRRNAAVRRTCRG